LLLTDISKGTVIAGAQIEFEIIPIKATCAACGAAFTTEKLSLNCAQCGSTDIQLTDGDQLEVVEIK
jgi:Zn finger protein HypA/HybF involved in hydrogenase expression